MLSVHLILLLLTFTWDLAVGSAITTYTDSTCQKSFNNLNVVNGYPDGVCTQLNILGNLQAFQIAKLDDGCAVTLYGANDNTNLPCSSPLKIVGKKAMCYNSSWVYYSVDNCVKPGSSSIILPSTASSLSPVTFTLATESSASASASQTNVAGSLEQPSRTGIIVGAIVGGVCIFAILFALALFCLRRRAKPAKPLPCPPSYELSQEHALIEASQSAVVPPNRTLQKEMWAHEVAVEIGRNSYAPPVELPAHDIGSDKKRMSSLIHVHMAR